MTDFDPKAPFNELPELPPPVDVTESNEILKKCINARVALAELKQAAELIPNAAVLVNALPLLEAQASSEIENIVTTTDKLFEFVEMAEDKADAATKEALRYPPPCSRAPDGSAWHADNRYGDTNMQYYQGHRA